MVRAIKILANEKAPQWKIDLASDAVAGKIYGNSEAVVYDCLQSSFTEQYQRKAAAVWAAVNEIEKKPKRKAEAVFNLSLIWNDTE